MLYRASHRPASTSIWGALEKAQQPDKAIANYRRAAEGPNHSPAAWLRLAAVYNRSSDLDAADRAFNEAERLYRMSSNLEGLTQVLFERGVAANRRGKYADGAAYLRRSIETARLAGNIQQETNAKLQLATGLYASGDVALAEQTAREALETAQANQFEELTVIGLLNLGLTHSFKRDFTGAAKLYNDALASARRNGFNYLIARCNFWLASLHDQLRRSADAEREAREALGYFEKSHWIPEMCGMLAVIGRSERNRGDFAAAAHTFQRLLDTARNTHDTSQMAIAYEGLGSTFLAQELFPQALEQYRKQVEVSPQGPSAGYARLGYGYALAKLGKISEAHAMWDAADEYAEKFPTLRVALQERRAALALIEADYAGALRIANRALAVVAGQDARSSAAFRRVSCLAKLGLGQKKDGLRDCRQAVSIATSLNDPAALLDARMALIQAAADNADIASAHAVFQECTSQFSSHPESHWRALAMVARGDRQYAAPAKDALGRLERLWGKSDFETYMRRRDVQQLARPVLGRNPAN